MPRFYCSAPLVSGELLALASDAARHAQVLRLQPGDSITLFNGSADEKGTAGEFDAKIVRMGRSEVEIKLGAYHPVQREAGLRVQLAVGMPANERMDWLVEKATELGVASITPLMTERSVLRLPRRSTHGTRTRDAHGAATPDRFLLFYQTPLISTTSLSVILRIASFILIA